MDPSTKVRARRVALTVRLRRDLHRWLASQRRKSGVPTNVFVERLIQEARSSERAAS